MSPSSWPPGDRLQRFMGLQAVAAGELQAYRIGSRKGVQITVRSIDAYIDRKAVKPDKA